MRLIWIIFFFFYYNFALTNYLFLSATRNSRRRLFLARVRSGYRGPLILITSIVRSTIENKWLAVVCITMHSHRTSSIIRIYVGWFRNYYACIYVIFLRQTPWEIISNFFDFSQVKTKKICVDLPLIVCCVSLCRNWGSL